MKRIGRYLITAVGLMSLSGATSLFAGDFAYARYGERREIRREERRDFRRYEARHDRGWFYRRGCR